MFLTQLPTGEYPKLLDQKVNTVRQIFADIPLPEASVFASRPAHYRMRAEFRVWHEGDDLFYAMFDPKDPKTPIRVDQFPVASEAIWALMPALINAIAKQTSLRQRLFQVEFLSTLADDMLVTLIYHRKLDDSWRQAAEQLSEALNIQVIGRSRKQRVVLDRDYVNETLQIDGQRYHYRQYEGGFTQPNAELNQTMISWAKQQFGHRPNEDLLELYCGNGNFTAPLATQFRQVLATEISKTSVRAARENFAANGTDNVRIARMSSEDFTSALNGEREFRRLEDIDLASFDFSSVFVDPPRAGLDEATCALISRFDHIVYISCNPHSLHRDLQLLTKSHRLDGFALFDQFPYTDHMECGAYLQRSVVDDSKTD